MIHFAQNSSHSKSLALDLFDDKELRIQYRGNTNELNPKNTKSFSIRLKHTHLSKVTSVHWKLNLDEICLRAFVKKLPPVSHLSRLESRCFERCSSYKLLLWHFIKNSLKAPKLWSIKGDGAIWEGGRREYWSMKYDHGKLGAPYAVATALILGYYSQPEKIWWWAST